MNDNTFMVSGGKDTQKISGSIAVDTTGLATETKQDAIITAIQAIPGGGGIQYTEGDTDATITGTAIMWEDAANTLVPVSSGKPLPVSASIDTTGLATSTRQDTIIGHVDGIETVLGTIDADTSILAGAVTAGKVQAEVTNTVTVGSHNVTNAGTFAVQVTSAPTTTVQATNLDVRDLTATDVVTVTGGAGQTADVKVTLDGESVPVTGVFWQATQPVSGTVAVSGSVTVQDGGGSLTVDNNGTFATQAAQSGTWTVQPGNTANTTPWLVAQQTYSTSGVTSIAGSASSVQILASTTGRKGAYFYNDSSAICYLKLGTTASTSSFTVAIPSSGFYELPYPCYTGRIDAIWASATGNLRVTEIT